MASWQTRSRSFYRNGAFSVLRWTARYTTVSSLPLDLNTPLKYVKGVGPARAAFLQAKGLETIEDLIHYAPFRYEDRSNVKTIAQLAPGDMIFVPEKFITKFRKYVPYGVGTSIATTPAMY